jgi:superfamily II DNA/RNA helicase
VVNYDLPWNPQRIEQRIGRCHRYGQEHPVTVVNFIQSHRRRHGAKDNAESWTEAELTADQAKMMHKAPNKRGPPTLGGRYFVIFIY